MNTYTNETARRTFRGNKGYGLALSCLLALIIMTIPIRSWSQDDHEGHDHDEHAHTEDVHEDEGHESHDDGEQGHEDEGYEGHDYGEEEHLDEVTLSAEAIELFGISITEAERRDLTGRITVPARVSYNTESMAHIGTQIGGRIQRIAVRLGDNVEQGDLLLVIDSPELGTAESDFLQKAAEVEAAETNVEAARAMITVAQTAYERAETLRQTNSVSVSEFLEREGELRRAEADVRRAEAQLKVAEAARQAAENQLHIYGYRHEDCDALLEFGEISTRYEVRAPISGRVIEREVTPGEVVDSEDEALMVLANMQELWVLADVPEKHVTRIETGSIAHVTVDAISESAFEGRIDYIAPQLDPRTRTASVRIVVPADSGSEAEGHHDLHDHEHDHDHADHGADEEETHELAAGYVLKPGMFGRAELSLSGYSGGSGMRAIAVEQSAIQDIEGGPVVFVPVQGEPNTFAMRSIQIGQPIGRWIPVLSGLDEGESYVATKTFLLKAELGKEGASHAH